MKNLEDYIQNLKFEYAISYSGLRGQKYYNLEIENREEINIIRKKFQSARFMQKAKLNKRIEELKAEINPYNSRIINKKGELHKSTKLVHKFEKEDKEIMSILKILCSKFDEQVFAMCTPTLRDSIVFYSERDKIVGILHICFSCLWMKNENGEDLEVDHRIFPLLKDKLIQVGHKIKDEIRSR